MSKRLPKVTQTRLSDLIHEGQAEQRGPTETNTPTTTALATVTAVTVTPEAAAPTDSETVAAPASPRVATAPNSARREAALSIVYRHTLYAGVTATMPQPGMDVAGVGASTYRMVSRLLTHYGHTTDSARIRQVVGSLVVGLLGPSVGRVGAWTLSGMVPMIGLWMPMVSAVSSALMLRQLGTALVDHLETGGTLENWAAPRAGHGLSGRPRPPA